MAEMQSNPSNPQQMRDHDLKCNVKQKQKQNTKIEHMRME
jgi:DNA-binding transcriptional regulator YiaG